MKRQTSKSNTSPGPGALRLAVMMLLVVPLLAGQAMPAAGQTPLGADLDNVFWLTDIAAPTPPYILAGTYDPATGWSWKQKIITIYYDPTDLPTWVHDGKVYFVICYGNLDRPVGSNYLEIGITGPKIPWPGLRALVSEFNNIAQPERCVTTLSSIDGVRLNDGVIYVDIRGPVPTQADAVSIAITKLGVAPPEGAVSDVSNDNVAEPAEQLSAGTGVDKYKYAAMGAGGVLIAVLFLHMASSRGRRRLFSAVVLLALLAPAVANVALGEVIDWSAYVSDVALDVTSNSLNTTLAGYGVTVNGSVITLADPDPNDTYIPAVTLDALPFDAIIRVVNGTVRAGDPGIAMTVSNGTIIVRGDSIIIDEVLAIQTAKPVIASDNATLLATPLFSEEWVETGSTITKSSATPPAKIYHVYMGTGKAYVQITNKGGSAHDVYIFKPGHPNYAKAEVVKPYWTYYALLKPTAKIMYPQTATSFTSDTAGNWLFVVIQFKKTGAFTLKITPPTGGGATTTTTTTATPMPTTPPTESSNPSAALPGGSKTLYAAMGAGIIIILLLAVMAAGGRRR